MNNETTMQASEKPIWLPIILIILAVGLFLNLCLTGVLVIFHIATLLPSDIIDEETTEDDVTIAGEYVIKSTLPISDAYISGDTSKLNATQKETYDMAAKVLDEIITPEMTPFEKEIAVYDWMCQNIAHDDGSLVLIPTAGSEVDEPHGVLKYHKAVCVGYATTFRLFMQMLEIPCMVEHNLAKYHSWDLVQLDGDWYITDIYSDAEVGGYLHFNMTDSMMMENGQDWDTDYFPSANSLSYNMIYRNAVTCSDIYTIPALLRNSIDNRDVYLSLHFDECLEDAQFEIIDHMINAIQERIYYTNEYGMIWLNTSCNYLDAGDILVIIQIYYESSDDPDEPVDPMDTERADQAVEDAFGDLTSSDYPIVWDDGEW